MAIAYIGPSLCPACRAPVYVYQDGPRVVTRDVGEHRTRHLCADLEKREDITIEDSITYTRCDRCGSYDVRRSTWGRLVEWCDSMAFSCWMEPLQEHVCGPLPSQRPTPSLPRYRTVDQ